MNLESLQPLFLVLAGIGLLLSLCTEQTQIIAKIRGAFAGKVASGYMSAMRIMLFNRIGTIIYMFFIALCIDTGISSQTLLLVSIFSSIGVMIYNLSLIINRTRVLTFKSEIAQERLIGFLFDRDRKYSSAAFAATLLNILGLTLPFLLSNTYPEYRLTMANTGFLLNTFFTLINVLILETRFAQILDHESHSEAYFFVMKILVSRTIAALVAVALLCALFIFIG